MMNSFKIAVKSLAVCLFLGFAATGCVQKSPELTPELGVPQEQEILEPNLETKAEKALTNEMEAQVAAPEEKIETPEASVAPAAPVEEKVETPTEEKTAE